MGDFDDEDEWRPAIAALIAQQPPDPKPLAALLRSGRTVSPGTADFLAEMLDPGEPEYLYCKFVLIETRTDQKQMLFYNKTLPIAHAHSQAMAAGQTYDDAAYSVAEKFSIDERTVKRHVASVKEFFERLHGKN